MNFANLIQRAYITTINHPWLWLFGLFLTSGFNLHWLVFPEQSAQWHEFTSKDWERLIHHHQFWIAIAGGLVFYLISVAIASWAKIILVLYSSLLLKIKRLKSVGQPANYPTEPVINASMIRESGRYIWQVIIISLVTTIITLAGAAALFIPSFFWIHNDAGQGYLVTLAVLVFLLLLFFTTFLSAFGSFFIIIHQQNVSQALNLGTDLILAKWRTILAFLLILMVIYGLSLMAGFGLLAFARFLISFGFSLLSGFGLFSTLVARRVTWVVISIILVALLSILNAFFNVALLLLFDELIKSRPIEAKAHQAELENSLPV